MNQKLVLYSSIGLLVSSILVTVAIARNLKTPTQRPLQSAEVNPDPHAGHSMGDLNGVLMNHDDPQESHSMQVTNRKAFQAELAEIEIITPNKPLTLSINIRDKNGKEVTQFETFQEKLMHLIVVSDNLQTFNHFHPTYKGNGRFEVEASFPQSGGYTIFSDYKPSGQPEEISVLQVQVPGNSQSTPQIDFRTTKTVADTRVDLTFSQPTLKANQEIALTFDLKQAANNQPITDLQPYLGEKGHLVILKQSSSLQESDYIHAHAIENNSKDKIEFITRFPQPGKHKLWGQFNRNGKLVVADFWVNVSP
jgi:hypothetical protein